LEEQQCFAGSDPNTGMRPDISILPGFVSDQKTILDIMVTCPVSEQPANRAKVKGTAATTAYRTKVRKYGAIALSNQLDF
jgi:hypothetical protein